MFNYFNSVMSSCDSKLHWEDWHYFSVIHFTIHCNILTYGIIHLHHTLWHYCSE